jgi:hypothetical protein
LRGDEGEGLCDVDEVPGRGRAVDSGGRPPVESELSGRTTGMGTEGGFSKLRAGVFPVAEGAGELETTVLAAPLLSCALALSFLAPAVAAAGGLGWGALEVIGASGNEKRSIYSTFNLPKQIQSISWPNGLF